MVPNAAVTAEVPELVSVNPLASVCNTKLTEPATVIVTANVADEDARAAPWPQSSVNAKPAIHQAFVFTGNAPRIRSLYKL